MKYLIYVSGPYRAPSRAGIELNIAEAKVAGLEIVAFSEKAYPVIPHLNTGGEDFEAYATEEYYLDATEELATRCDAVLLLKGWHTSVGAQRERKAALERDIPVYELDPLDGEGIHGDVYREMIDALDQKAEDLARFDENRMVQVSTQAFSDEKPNEDPDVDSRNNYLHSDDHFVDPGGDAS